MKLSIIIPVFNEEENVTSLHKEILETLKNIETDYEIIFINDGSSDNTLEKLKNLSPITIINFRKNFGQTSALDAGIKHSSGKIIITMDGDGQNDPKDIPLLLEKIKQGYDVAAGWRWRRKDSLIKRLVSKGSNFIGRFFIKGGVHDMGCTFRAYKKDCFKNIDLYGEMHRFIPGILRWQGFKIAEIKVNHRPRNHGKTKYNWKRTIKGFLDMILVWFWRKYSARPLHLFGAMGLLFLFSGSIIIIYLFVMRIIGLISLQATIWPLVGFFLVIMGIQLIVSGLIADILIKNYYKTHKDNPYSIKEIIEKK